MQVDWLKKNLKKLSDLTTRVNLVRNLSTTKELPVSTGAKLLGINRTSVYYGGIPVSEEELECKSIIDHLHTDNPTWGARQMSAQLKLRGYHVGRRKASRYMREMDITYIPMKHGFLYLTAIIDWYSRCIVGWDVDDTLDTTMVINACKKAFKVAKPLIINSDQDSQFTSDKYIDFIRNSGIRQSMDGKSRWADNIMIERWFRSFKYEEAYLTEYANLKEAREAIGRYIYTYNFERCHQSIGNKRPAEYLEKKGHIKKPRINTVMPKPIYVYEDVSFDGSKHELVNCHYFGGDYAGTEGTKELWQEVFDFITESYDEEVLEKIYINGDGADWIRTGAGMHAKARFVLDRFHMHKYIISATSHLKDSAQDARSEIYRAINGKRKWAAEEAFDKILHVTESETKAKAVESAKNYILGNWAGIMESVRATDKSLQCSAEGHVSHIYSDRMSSRPLGWSRTGADKMARLRIYRQNKRDILELVRYQKKELPLAAGAEEVIYSATQMLAAERRNKNRLGKLADMPVYSIPYPQIKKIAALKNHIWGL